MHPVVGVDPHKHVLSAVALDARGGVLGRWSGSAARSGISARHAWAARQAPEAVWAIEGSNALGRRLALVLGAAGADVRDVCPTRTADRRRRRPGRGKTDALDAEAVARELLADPGLPHAFKAAGPARPDPAREALAVLVRARHQVVDHRRLLTEAEAVLTELPARTAERLPGGAKVVPRLRAAARLRRTGERATDLRLRLLRSQARHERALAAERDGFERETVRLLEEIGSSLPALFGLGPLGAAELLAEVGDPRRFRSADAFASYTGTAPIPAASAEDGARARHDRLSRYGNRRLNSVLHVMAVTRLRTHPETQAFVARARAAGKSTRDALRIVKRRLARLVWTTMMRDLPAPAAAGAASAAADGGPPFVTPIDTEGSPANPPATSNAGAGRHPQGRSAAEQPRAARLDAPAGAEPTSALSRPLASGRPRPPAPHPSAVIEDLAPPS